METEGLDFAGALEWLADRAGIELEREAEDPAAAARRERSDRLHALLERTAAYYVRLLWESGEAAGRVSTWPAAGWRRRRCGSSASGTRRVRTTEWSAPRCAPATARTSCWPAGWPSSGATAAG